jgi:hypothetical protein
MSLDNRGRRESRVSDAPAASCAKVESTRVSHHRLTGSVRLSLRNGFTAYFVLSPVTGLFCHRRRADNSAKLDASVGASGPHDFAVRVSTIRQARRPRPPHPVPYVRDDRETPLCVGRDGGSSRSDLGRRRSEIFFAEGLDR